MSYFVGITKIARYTVQMYLAKDFVDRNFFLLFSKASMQSCYAVLNRLTNRLFHSLAALDDE